MLLLPLDADNRIPLRRAPDVRQACAEAWGEARGPLVVSLRELLGLIGAHEWRLTGIDIPATGGRIHPHYGVFAPIRREYVDLVAQRRCRRCLRHPASRSTSEPEQVCWRRARAAWRPARSCHRSRPARVGMRPRESRAPRRAGAAGGHRAGDLFPEGRAALVVCNPPWVPARPSSPLEHGIYDPESRMLRGFLGGLAAHLEPGGEGWLIMSDLAEHLGLRTRAELLAMFDAAELKVVDRSDIRPKHPRVTDEKDALHAARTAEVTSLWRLAGLR
jgi:hypothetical protein